MPDATDVRKRVEDEIREKIPATAEKADWDRSRATAVYLHCRACMGGQRAEVERCTDTKCFLWSYRCPSATESPDVPDRDEYLRLKVEAAGGEEAYAELQRKGQELAAKNREATS